MAKHSIYSYSDVLTTSTITKNRRAADCLRHKSQSKVYYEERPVLAVLELPQTTRYLAWRTHKLGIDSICTLILTVYICAYTRRYFPACIDGFRSIFSQWQLEGKGSCDADIDQSAGSIVM